MKIAVLLLALLTVSEGNTSPVKGRTGQNVTLSCNYDISRHGALSACWSRGQIPASGCSDLLVSTDGHKVKEETRASSRYQLLGRLEAGDVSLTILNASQGDTGEYGCRVEIPGWFNDEKHVFHLIIERAAQTTTSAETSAAPTAAAYTTTNTDVFTGQMTSTERLLTSSFTKIEAEDSSSLTVPLVCILLGLALVAAGGVIIVRRWRKHIKIPQQQFNSSVQFSATSPSLQLHGGGTAVENIYNIDVGGDGGEYEYCP